MKMIEEIKKEVSKYTSNYGYIHGVYDGYPAIMGTHPECIDIADIIQDLLEHIEELEKRNETKG